MAISVQVVYAQPPLVWQKELRLAEGTSARQALQASGFFQDFPDYPSDALVIGIYGQVCEPARILVQGDRIEVYRPLTFDPLESRRRRAVHRQAFMTKPRNRPKRRKAKLAAAAASEPQGTSEYS